MTDAPTPGPHPTPSRQETPREGSPRKVVNLALQGGGAHGAFTWGVLDALLEDGRLAIEGISGTSAGAMNAGVMACGLAGGGPEGARQNLAAFWRDVSVDGNLGDGQRAIFDVFLNAWSMNPAGQGWASLAAQVLSPYDLNPLDLNPLRQVVEKHIDFKRLRAYRDVQLFIAATNVRTGKVRVFHRRELTADMLMASAALPTVFKAVTIDGQPYWDGGYMGNPVLFPFFTETKTEDILLVQINPVTRDAVPETSRDIMERMNEITFNASLLHELRAIDFVRRLKDEGRLDGTHYKRIRMHRIDARKEMEGFGASSKMQADWSFFQTLHEIGRKAAKRFLKAHFDDIGVEGSMNLPNELA